MQAVMERAERAKPRRKSALVQQEFKAEEDDTTQ